MSKLQFDHLGVTGARPLDANTPFRIGILGDFSGAQNRGERVRPLHADSPVILDRDSFEDVMARIRPALQLLGGARHSISLTFSSLEHFHPDHLIAEHDLFSEMRSLRYRLSKNGTFSEAAKQVTRWKQEPPQPDPPKAAQKDGGSLLDAVISGERNDAGGARFINDLVSKAVANHISPVDPRKDELIAAVDEGTGDLVRALLQHPDFQELEALWRGVLLLLRRLDTDRKVQLNLIDVRKSDLVSDLLPRDDLRESGFYQMLAGHPGDDPWSLILGNFNMWPAAEDAALTARLASVTAHFGATFIAGASPLLAGYHSFGSTPDTDDQKAFGEEEDREAWREVRRLPACQRIALVLPRILGRYPYGRNTDPLEIPFEEINEESTHEHYLWINGALAVGLALGMGFCRHGSRFRPGDVNEVGDLPLYVHQGRAKPCAEALITDRVAADMIERGLTPIRSFRERDAVHIGPIVALAGNMLEGRWD